MFIGVDIGGTKMLGVAGTVDVQSGGAPRIDVQREQRVPTPTEGDALVDALLALVRELGGDDSAAPEAVAVGIAGMIDRHGVVRYSPHLPDVVQLPLAARLRDALGCPVVVENDHTTTMLAEARMGAGRGCRDLVVVGLGTGIGTKFLVDGVLLRGANGFAGESGHMTIDRNAPRHVSGVRKAPRHVSGVPGAWEMFGSGSGLGDLARELAGRGEASSLLERAGTIDEITGETVAHAVADGDTDALAVLDAFAEQVAIGVANLIAILDPQRVVLGGGVSEMGEPLRARVETATQRRVVGARYRPAVPVVLAELGEQAGALGALLAAADAAGPRHKTAI
jgi:glucokinase